MGLTMKMLQDFKRPVFLSNLMTSFVVPKYRKDTQALVTMYMGTYR
jgi:hypothetical protein